MVDSESRSRVSWEMSASRCEKNYGLEEGEYLGWGMRTRVRMSCN